MSWIEVVLDTQVNLGVEFEAGPEPNTIIVKLASDEDVVDVKLWGAIDVTDPANANYAEDQGSAEWFSFASELIVKVAPGEGQKVFRVQVRDDVWNESEVATIKFGVAPEEEVEVAPSHSRVAGSCSFETIPQIKSEDRIHIPRRRADPDRGRARERQAGSPGHAGRGPDDDDHRAVPGPCSSKLSWGRGADFDCCDTGSRGTDRGRDRHRDHSAQRTRRRRRHSGTAAVIVD
jgi:hypothetical protein